MSVTARLLSVSLLLFVAASAAVVFIVRDSARQRAIDQAEEAAKLLLDRNLATHSFYTHELKPRLTKLFGSDPNGNVFEPAWMSSTYAVRRINKYAGKLDDSRYYYKECAINARSPENEADEYEGQFLKDAATDPNLTNRSEIRLIDGIQYLQTLRRGESMEKDCLRCHSVPAAAPAGMVDLYGEQRSFGRREGELVSAISTRIPIGAMFAEADRLAWKLSGVLMGVLMVLLTVKYLMQQRMVILPLKRIGEKVSSIVESVEHLGEQVDVPAGKELADVATAINRMSASLRAGRDELERRVMERTEELAREVDEHRKADKAAQESERRYRTLFESLTEGFALHEIILDDQGKPCDYRFIEVNPAFEQLTGLSSADIIGRTAREVLPEIESDWIDTYGQVAVTGEPSQFENYSHELKKHFRVLAYSPWQGQFAVLFVDITERKRAEEDRLKFEARILHAQKLESLGVLAGGIAHDFNNLLVAILGYADLALRDLTPAATARSKVEEIKKASLRAAQLTSQMLAYSGKGRFVIEPVDLSGLVSDMAHLLEISKSKKVLLRYDLAENLPAVEGDAAQLGQVVMNLITNAAEAIGDKSGVIALRTGVMEASQEYLLELGLGETLPPGYYAYLEVSDTGCGMDKQTIARMFEPFFTTKFTGRGLGLSALLGIIRGHKGAVKVYSEVGKGTTFKVLLPCMDHGAAPASGTKKVVESANEWRGGGTILVADDEEAVRTVAKMMLTSMGFDVLVARDGQETVDVYQKHADDISLVLLDMTMPRLSGEEAFREMRRINPEVRVILCSGYNEQEAINRFTGKGLAGFIQKPYQFQTLLAKFRQVLEG